MAPTKGFKATQSRPIASAWLASLLIHAGFMMLLAVSTSAIEHFGSPARDVTEMNVSFIAPTYDVPPVTPEFTELPAVEEPRVVDWQRIEEIITEEPVEAVDSKLVDDEPNLQNTAGIDLASLENPRGGAGIAFVESRFDAIPQRKRVTAAPTDIKAIAGGGSGSSLVGVGGGEGSGSGQGSGTGTGSGSGPGDGNASPSGLGAGKGTGIGSGEGSGREPLTRPARPKQMERGPYPADARRSKLEGVVTLGIEVLANGRVGEVNVAQSSGHASLDRAAREAAQNWRFEPAEAYGRAVTSQFEIRYRFRLVDSR
jgi:TonB family protein